MAGKTYRFEFFMFFMFFTFLRFLGFNVMHCCTARYTRHKNTIEKKAYTEINSCSARPAYVERYKIRATPMNSNTEFDSKKS